MRPLLPAYAASFTSGVRQTLNDKTDMTIAFLLYSILLIVFSKVFAIMPLHELGMPGLTQYHMLRYFAVAESIVIGGPMLYFFGKMISEGCLTEMLTRPTNILLLVASRVSGMHIIQTLALMTFAMAALPVFTGATIPTLPLEQIPLFLFSVVLGTTIYDLLGYIISTLEIHGPYGRPAGWIIGKLIFSFGGLFFPVIFFPPIMQKIVWLTPFPSVIFAPGSFMLGLDTATHLRYIGIQILWVIILTVAALFVQRRMINIMLERGE